MLGFVKNWFVTCTKKGDKENKTVCSTEQVMRDVLSCGGKSVLLRYGIYRQVNLRGRLNGSYERLHNICWTVTQEATR